MTERITIKSVNILFFIIVVLYLLFNIVLGFISHLYEYDIVSENMYMILLSIQVLLLLLPITVFVLIKRLNVIDFFRIKGIKLHEAVLILIISVLAMPVAALINSVVLYFLQKIGEIPINRIPVPKTLSEYIFGLLVIAFTPAICEELLHRGLILRAYEKVGVKKALIISSIYFGMFHFDIQNLAGPIFLGLLIGYYVLRTGSIISGVFAHFCNNAFSLTVGYITKDQPTSQYINIEPKDLVSIIVITVILLLVVMFFLFIFHNVTKTKNTEIEEIERNTENTEKEKTESCRLSTALFHWPVPTIFAMYLCIQIISIWAALKLK